MNKTVPSISYKRQSENRTMPARGGRREPLDYWQKDKNKVCLPAKRLRSSTLGIGTVSEPFSSLQEKALYKTIAIGFSIC